MLTHHNGRKAFFDYHASTWEESESFSENAENLARIITRLSLRPGDRVLDVGTGTGIALPSLREKVGEDGTVVGIDLSENMLMRANGKCNTVVQGDAHNLPFPRDTFDCVFAFAVIPHLDDLTCFFGESARILSSGGLLVVLHLMSRKECNDFHRKAGTAVEHDMLPSGETLTGISRSSGFRSDRFEEHPGLFLWTARWEDSFSDEESP